MDRKLVSVICEYNPFHFGHLYQMERLRSDFGAVVCIMSGNIVQRGSIAVADKYLRARTALNSGANLVLELPLPWCCASAKDFASAGVRIAQAIGSDFLAFGIEEDQEALLKMHSFMEGEDFSRLLSEERESCKNLSYPQLLSRILEKHLGAYAKEALAKPNNILALEYLSALKGTGISPYGIKRNTEFLSSSEIRKSDGEAMINALPQSSGEILKSQLGISFPTDGKKLDSFYIGTLRAIAHSGKALDGLYSVTDDLARKILAAAMRASSVNELVSLCRDKIYTDARIRRAVNSMVFAIEAESVICNPPYTCVLAADRVGCDILKNAKNNKIMEIITKPVKALSADKDTKNAFLLGKRIDDIVSLASPVPPSAEEGKTPYIIE